ncbi:hypothetical protein A5655_22015 [Mycobacterium sp. 1081908.1]|nr:hypothetical protein A5655_22015 [Mycobacterium sp. 1081908.1]
MLGAAIVLGAAALLSAPVLARARPPVPLDPVCDRYQFIGDYSLRQANGFIVQFRSTGPSASGSASALDSSGKTAMTGTVSGGIDRTRIDFTIRWGSGPRGHYTGEIDGDGFARGTTVDEANHGPITNWGATVPLGCATPAPTGPRPGPSNGPILAPTTTRPAPSAGPEPTVPSRQP